MCPDSRPVSLGELHQGHRQRLKQRFLEEGLESFEPHQILELLLFYALPRGDTNPLAHRLLNRFGSLEQVFLATPEQLMTIEGVSEHTAILLGLYLPTVHHFAPQRLMQEPPLRLNTPKATHEALAPLFLGRHIELAYVVCLNSADEVIDIILMGHGSEASVVFSCRKLLEAVLPSHAVRIILAHNHPTGACLPSSADVSSTQKILKALTYADIALSDHLIFDSLGNHFSMEQNRLIHADLF